ncbi:MAG TPA: tripartite tricarboxylate transporter TctB family protein [Zeimonas sp.]|nr:tripartite tricarboxylate transporter TctB family protein [Zeimonas sp.]
MRIRNHRDFWSGVLFLVLGSAFAVFSSAYQLGTPARMGPGFFPMMLGVLLALLGVATIWMSTARTNPETGVERIGWRPLIVILGSVALFALLLPRLGMVVSVAVLIGLSAIASHEFRWKETLLEIVVLLVLSWLVFVKGLELQFPVWPTLFSP